MNNIFYSSSASITYFGLKLQSPKRQGIYDKIDSKI